MNKKVVISGYYGYDNFGDEAILAVLIDHLRQMQNDVTVLSHSPFKTSRTYGVKSVKNFNILGVLFSILRSDVLISGGGSLLQDVSSMRSLLYYSFVIWLAIKLKKQVLIFAHGIGPLQSDLSRKIVFNLLSRCTLVTVRDLKSQKLLADNGISAKLVSDPVFTVDLPVSTCDGSVGVQLRAYRAVDDAFLFTLAQQIVRFFGDRKIQIFVFQRSIDLEISKKFEKMLKTIHPKACTEIVHSVPNSDMIMMISKLEYMVAMRFHAVLVAIKMGVKTLAINYDAKVEQLAYDAMLPLLTISIEEDFEPPFERLLTLKSEDILEFSSNQIFEWKYFDKYLK